MLRSVVGVGLLKPQNVSVVACFPMPRYYSVQKPRINKILVKWNRSVVHNLSPQMRYFSSSGLMFNVAPPEPVSEVLEDIISNVVKTDQVTVVTGTNTNELLFDIPEKPEVAPPNDTITNSEVQFEIPEKPAPLEAADLIGEPSFDSLGLASWWPSGRIQYLLENLHLGLGLEWYQAIAIATLIMRMLMLPLVVIAQRNMANMNNNSPAMAAIQEKMTDARRRGDVYESAQLGQELQIFMSKKGINPLKNAVPIFVQVPVFMSFFFALRGMAYCPVESMSTGGLFWFENMTMTDPFYLLPFLTSATMYLQLRLGAEGARLDQMGPKMKIAMTVMPFIIFPLTMNFPSAVTFYWFSTNIISVCQSQTLRIPALRQALKIPVMIKHDINKALPGGRKKGFKESFRDTMDNWKVQGAIVDRRQYDEKMFREAGAAKPVKTFKYDPTKPIAMKQFKK